MDRHPWITTQLIAEQQDRQNRDLTTRRRARHANRNRRHDAAR